MSTRYEMLQQLITIDTDNCIEWPYAKTYTGHGVVGTPGSNNGRPLSRVILEMTGRPQPDMRRRWVACHNCHNSSCANPRHLRWDTYKANYQDGIDIGTIVDPPHRLPRRLTPDQVRHIRQTYAAGQATLKELGDQHGVAHNTVWLVVKHKTYKDVT